MSHRVAVIGAGGVGRKRAASVAADERCELVAVADIDAGAAESLAAEHGVAAHGAVAHSDWRAVIDDTSVSLVVVSTTHDALAAITVAALETGKHVLCEKPLGRSADEVRLAVDAAQAAGCVLRAGYNHRFHPAIEAAHAAARSGRLGELMYLRGRYGHGGRPGYEREWRADPGVSGGGELLDQGAHLIDLSHWFLDAEFASVQAHTLSAYWDMAVEDNAFALLQTAAGQVASLHVSWTQWRNLFSLEVFGRDGYALVEGLGGSYGVERLTIGHRRPEGGVPEEETQTFDGPDDSWAREWDVFIGAVEGGDTAGADGTAALHTMLCIRRIYEAAQSVSTGSARNRQA